ncbi:MAG: hypothetical protein OEO82_11220, partial [Gammaproteobacteria bacterium]|nr:hypothetical protein [Gammaproteobacteria bacterium]
MQICVVKNQYPINYSRNLLGCIGHGLLASILCVATVCLADHPNEEEHEHLLLKNTLPAQRVDYPAEFFQRYQPNSALDMVNQ